MEAMLLYQDRHHIRQSPTLNAVHFGEKRSNLLPLLNSVLLRASWHYQKRPWQCGLFHVHRLAGIWLKGNTPKLQAFQKSVGLRAFIYLDDHRLGPRKAILCGDRQSLIT